MIEEQEDQRQQTPRPDQDQQESDIKAESGERRRPIKLPHIPDFTSKREGKRDPDPSGPSD